MSKKKKSKISIIANLAKNSLRLTKIVWGEKKGTVILLLFISFALSAFSFLQSGSRGLLINELVKIVGGQSISFYFLILIGAIIVANFLPSLFYAWESYLFKLFWFFLEEKFELLLIKKKGEVDIAVREDPKKNDLINKVFESGVWRIQNFVDRQFYIMQGAMEVVIAAAVLIFANWWVFTLIFIGTIPELVVEMKYGRRVWNIHTSKAEIKRKFWNVKSHFERLPSLVELKLFQNTLYFIDIIRDLFRNFREEEKRNERKRLWYRLISLTVGQIVVAVATIWFIFEVINGNIQIGTLTFIIASIGNLRRSLSGLFNSFGQQYQDNLFITDVFKFLDLKPIVKKKEKGIVLDSGKAPKIVFDDVTFRYPGTDKVVLKNFSLSIAPGEKIAFVGVNGAGKTTFVKLLCRFYDPDKGRILIDGHDLREIDLESWYIQLGAIFQDYAHYHFLVKEAIAMGRTGQKPAIEKVKEAAKAGEADIFIEEWEKAYGQMLGKEFTGGVEPSIGQWQKLALARVFYRDPKVLVLDEPTSSIDAEAEAKIFERIEKISQDRTVILISHRFSTVRRANRIAVIKRGKIDGLGTHEELLKKDGTYARLFKLQAEKYQ